MQYAMLDKEGKTIGYTNDPTQGVPVIGTVKEQMDEMGRKRQEVMAAVIAAEAEKQLNFQKWKEEIKKYRADPIEKIDSLIALLEERGVI